MGSRLYRMFVCAGLFFLAGCASANRPLQLVSGAGPVYPAQAKAQGIEGDVTIRYDVDEAGRVMNARVVHSQPPGIFDEAALTAVLSWQFNAPVVGGQKQPARNRESTVGFRLSGADAYDRY